MATKKIFISFDYENDKYYKFLLEAWSANKNIDFSFNDMSSQEINSYNIDRIKAALTNKIKDATYTLVIVGKEANKKHKDSNLIGHTNWINFEIARSKQYKNKLIAVKLDRNFVSPEELLNAEASWALSFTQDSIIKAIENASKTYAF